MKHWPLVVFGALLSPFALAASANAHSLELTHSWIGYTALVIFVVAYVFVVLEEKIHLRKSKPVLVAAGLIWVLIAIAYNSAGASEVVKEGVRHIFLEYAELFFFLLVAMTYINAMLERGVFDTLRYWLVSHGFSYRQLFLITGVLAFFISPIADNLTTALILCAVVLAVGKDKKEFVAISCVGIVIAANAGGAFSPFGDITTLMVWQKGIINFWGFFDLIIPSLVNYLVPAFCMYWFVEKGSPSAVGAEKPTLKYGGYVIVALFLCTIATTVILHSVLDLPPVIGMMIGLSYLKLFGFHIRRLSRKVILSIEMPPGHSDENTASNDPIVEGFDVFDRVGQAEWDTLFFFYGVIMAVGGLGFIGYLSIASEFFYTGFNPTIANVFVGFLSAIVDNIPVMFAVLSMQPDMPQVQWLLVTLTAGV
ncbi:MAG: Na+/H+ antiporter NhaD/arsenite permease-like protein, partial [Flavobacteriales bacterium]